MLFGLDFKLKSKNEHQILKFKWALHLTYSNEIVN